MVFTKMTGDEDQMEYENKHFCNKREDMAIFNGGMGSLIEHSLKSDTKSQIQLQFHL